MHVTRYVTGACALLLAAATPVAALPAHAAAAPAVTARAVPAPAADAPAFYTPDGVSAWLLARSDCGITFGVPRVLGWLDGFGIRWLPRGLGSLVSDFEYEWDDVSFTSRVWETGPDSDGGYRVDLQVTVLRGAVLTSSAAMHQFLAEYHEREPQRWARERFRHQDGSGFRTRSEVFWLAQPGVAVWVHADRGRFTDRDLVRTACGVTARLPRTTT